MYPTHTHPVHSLLLCCMVYLTDTHPAHSLAILAILVLIMCHYVFLSPCALFPNPIRDMYGKKLHDPYLVAACHVVEEPGVETEALLQEEQDVGRTRIEEERHAPQDLACGPDPVLQYGNDLHPGIHLLLSFIIAHRTLQGPRRMRKILTYHQDTWLLLPFSM